MRRGRKKPTHPPDSQTRKRVRTGLWILRHTKSCAQATFWRYICDHYLGSGTALEGGLDMFLQLFRYQTGYVSPTIPISDPRAITRFPSQLDWPGTIKEFPPQSDKSIRRPEHHGRFQNSAHSCKTLTGSYYTYPSTCSRRNRRHCFSLGQSWHGQTSPAAG